MSETQCASLGGRKRPKDEKRRWNECSSAMWKDTTSNVLIKLYNLQVLLLPMTLFDNKKSVEFLKIKFYKAYNSVKLKRF